MVKVARIKRPRVKRVGPTAADEARRIEADVRAWYLNGQKLHGLRKSTSEGVGRAMGGIAGEAGTNVATLRQARRFGEVYTEEQLEALLKLRTPEGLPLGWSHVQVLISVGSVARRRDLQRKAAAQGWSVRELRAEVYRLQGRRSLGGRAFGRPGTPEIALERLDQLSRAWLHIHKSYVLLNEHGTFPATPAAASPGVGPELAVRMRRVAGRLAEVQDVARMVAAELDRSANALHRDHAADRPVETQAPPKPRVRASPKGGKPR